MQKFNAKILTQIKSVSEDGEDNLIIEGYANTVSKDRAGDVIPRSAWETRNALTNYLKNPIILAYHDHKQPIGKMIEYEVTDMGLKIKASISSGAGNVYKLIKDGILSTFSVGFAILDAEYESKSDTYFITDVELHEVSVVSVPCNQDSTFSVAKSMESADFESFKKNLTPEVDTQKDTNEMSFDLEKFKQEILAEITNTQSPSGSEVAEAVTQALAAEKAKEKAAADAKAAKAAEIAEVSAAATAAAKAEAKAIVDELQAKLGEKDTAFAEAVKAHEEKISQLKDEIAQVVASRTNPTMNTVPGAVKSAFAKSEKEFEQDVDTLVMLGIIKEKNIFETDFGKNYKVKVNTSSSIQVSSDGYETEFSTNLLRDIQARLVVAPLFTEMVMNQANLTLPINPDRGNATWVTAAQFGTANSSGAEVTVALTERTLKTYKLAAKTYMTEETQEDAIIPLIPLLRQHLVEAHANEIDRAFLLGTGTNQPKGLVVQATAAGAVHTSTATATGTVKVTAKMLIEQRRLLGLYGIDISDLALVISQDAYWDLILDSEWADVQQVGTAATKLNGEVGNIYGMPVIISNQFAAKAASTAYAVLVNKSNFVVTRQRGVTLRSDFDVEFDRTVFVATQRLNLEPLIEASAGNGKGVMVITYAA